VLYHYGDADAGESGALEQHLHDCETCRARLEELRRALDAVSVLAVPERGEGYGAEVWARLQPALAATKPRRWWSFSFPSLVFAGGVAALLVAAFVAGQYWPRQQPAAPGGQASAAGPVSAAPDAASAERVRERVLYLAVGDHLERSQVALVELMNAGGGAQPVDISSERERARDLVSENRLYRQTAADAGDAGVAAVLDELERVLMEIANSPSELTLQDLQRVRERIESQGIIFKVRVLGNTVRQRERPKADRVIG
jgi:hypothetical protein